MKTRSLIHPVTALARVRFILLPILAGISVAMATLFAQTPDNRTTADKITSARVFSQPLIWTGEQPATEADSTGLWHAIETFTSHGTKSGIGALENFIARNPNSPWTPSLRANLGKYYRDRGRYTLALEHWEKAWMATKNTPVAGGKSVGDFTVAHWTRLLASLGRRDQLQLIFLETGQRRFSDPVLAQHFQATKQGYGRMVRDSGVAYRCGTFALQQVGTTLKGTNFNRNLILGSLSPEAGFSLSLLKKFSDQAGLDLVPVERTDASQLAVPSVVHWKQEHYAAIVERRGDLCKVVDPTFGTPKWLSVETINAEASGYFMIERQRTNATGWRILSESEAGGVFGRGYRTVITFEFDCDGNVTINVSEESIGEGEDDSPVIGGCMPGNPGCPGPGGPGGSGPGGPDPSPGACEECEGGGATGGGGPNTGFGNGGGLMSVRGAGMARWSVTQPYTSLWITDTPLFYNTPLNGTMFFKLQSKQNQTRPTSTNIFGFGKTWHANVHTYLSVIDPQEDPNYAYYEATHYASDGAERLYLWDDAAVEFFSRTKLERMLDGNDDLVGFQLTYSDGSVAEFAHLRTNLVGELEAFLTRNSDPTGKGVVTLNYQTTNDVVRLASVVDALGGTNIFRYDTNRIHLVAEIENPFGQKASFTYNGADYLTNITDLIGLSSSFGYNASGVITNLTTPYGTTSFTHAEDDFPIGPANDVSRAWRALEATQPNGARHLYLYRTTVTHPAGPAEELFQYGTFEEYGHYNTHNSLYIGPRQYVLLSTTNYAAFTTNDMHLAVHQLWDASLIEPDEDEPYYNPTGKKTATRLPSPDGGITEGHKWFYTYDSGQSVPRKTWWLMPDGTTNYVEYIRNQIGYPTNTVSVWTRSDGTLATRTNRHEYAENGIDLLRVIGPDGHVEAAYGYSTNHQVLTVTNTVGDVTLYTYNTNGQITSVSLPTGLTSTNIYDANSWLEKTINLEIGRTNAFTWTNGLVHTHLNECGLAITNTWDPLNRLTSRVFPDGTTVSNVYEKLDLISTKDRLGNWTHRGIDSMRRVTAVTNALGHVTSYAYCPCGSLEYITNALGQVTTFMYDTAGRRTAVLQPDNSVSTRVFDKLGRLLSTTDVMGVSITNYYNHQSLIVAVSNAVGRVRAITFDIHDRATNVVDANGISISMTHDDLGRTLTRTYPDGGVEKYGYSARGLIAYTNQLGKITTYGYDPARRKVAETNANNEVITFTYSPADEMLTLTDGKNQTTTWNYDQYCRVTNKVDADSTEIFRYAYDANSRLTNRWSAAKGNTAYSHDAVGNLTNVNYAVSPDISMAYDALNRLTNMVDAVGAMRYGYTVTGRLEFEDGPWDDDTVNLDYHTNGQRKSVGLPGPHGRYWLQSYAYDTANRLSAITSPAGAFQYEYISNFGGTSYASSLIHKLHLPGGSRIVNSYDDVGRLTSTKLLNSATNTLNLHAYLYNLGGQRTKQTFTDGNYVDYTYDESGQLQSAKGSESGGGGRAHEQFGYAYDAAGNLNWRTNNALIQDFNVNSLNQITNVGRSGTLTVAGKFEMGTPPVSVTVNDQSASVYGDYTFAKSGFSLVDGTNNFTAIATDNASQSTTNAIDVYLPATTTFQYDSNGNLLSDGRRAFAYDDENQLVSVLVTNAWKSEFVYDGKMRRRVRKEYTWESGDWSLTNEVRYVYDGKLVIQERDGNNAARVTYTRGRDLSGSLGGAGGIGGLLARSEISNLPSAITTHAFYHSDGNGNITSLINPEQVLVAQYGYDPYGNLLSKSGIMADANLYRSSSKEFHAASGLVYYLYRFYDSTLQRWLNKDPLGDGGSMVYAINLLVSNSNPLREEGIEALRRGAANLNSGRGLYTFINNDSVNTIDPFGLVWYGNYCGPGNNPGEPPRDDVDACCQEHDDCYANTSVGGFPGMICPSFARRECDWDFCGCLAAASCNGWWCNVFRAAAAVIFCGRSLSPL